MNSDPRSIRFAAFVVLVALLTGPPAWAIAAGASAAALLAVRERLRLAARRRRIRTPAPEAAVSLGADSRGEQVVLTDHQLSAHGLIVGASGAGKSTTMLRLLSEYVRAGRPVVAIDMKGSPTFARELAAAAASVDRPFRLWTPDGPDTWNPLAHGNATELKDKLIATERFTEPHYQRAAERYLQAVLQVLQRVQPDRPPTLSEVAQLMDPHRLPPLLRGIPAPFAERVQDYISSLTADQLSGIRGLGTRLSIITESHTGEFLGPAAGGRAPIDLRAALAGEEVVAFSLNSSTYGGLSAQLGALAIQDLVAAAGHRLTDGATAAQAIVGIDEFSVLDGDNVISLLARSREAGVSVLLCTQELADLDRVDRGLRDQVLGSTAIKIAHRQDVPASARAIAEMAGTETVWEQTRQIGVHPLFGELDTGRGTRRQSERFIVHPNAIKSLRTGEAVLLTKLPEARVRTIAVAAPRVPEPRPRAAGARRPADARDGPER